jgi:subtilisin family serine protease
MADFADAKVAVLNISFGAVTFDDQPPLVLGRAVEKLVPEVTIVAAAGNHGPNSRPIWPAALGDVVAVGAAKRVNGTNEFKPAKFSPKRKWVDLVAPGEKIRSLYKADGYATWNGTSFSAAAVSGAIAYLVETENMSRKEALEVLRTPPMARKLSAASEVIDDIGPRR